MTKRAAESTPRRTGSASRIGRNRKPWGQAAKARWAALIEGDALGIDRDIEKLIGVYCTKLGCTRDRASAEIVRKLSWLTEPRGAGRMEEAC